jgi:hypothetical protein
MKRQPIVPDELAYYSPESFFPALAENFAETGHLDPEAFYLLLDWKASRARTKHLSRLTKKAGSFPNAVRLIADALREATEPDQLRILMDDWHFRLPTATAILSVLYPETFTIYDVRVCAALRDFDRLGNSTKWTQNLWKKYKQFLAAVRGATPPGFSLRNRDRWLWGRNKASGMRKEIGLKPLQYSTALKRTARRTSAAARQRSRQI